MSSTKTGQQCLAALVFALILVFDTVPLTGSVVSMVMIALLENIVGRTISLAGLGLSVALCLQELKHVILSVAYSLGITELPLIGAVGLSCTLLVVSLQYYLIRWIVHRWSFHQRLLVGVSRT